MYKALHAQSYERACVSKQHKRRSESIRTDKHWQPRKFVNDILNITCGADG